ncbi:MAG: alpha/beta hydrolase [Gammaproteobacteria bacterium]|nr:alpha/beta hydrolase [Gammaproteobacteria bacterium]
MQFSALHRVTPFLLLIVVAGFSHKAAANHSDRGYDYVNVPPVEWAPCFQDFGPFECAIYQVPLKHSKKSKYFYVNGYEPGIDLALIRLPASDQANKIGSLFLNPGGPGGSGVSFVLNAANLLYTPEVRARFDMVGVDPRGIGQSTGLSCYTSFDHLDEFFALQPFPQTVDEIFQQIRFDKSLRKNCKRNAGPILDHMTTADTARDMDILREAVGDKGLTYAGYSYGSFLGVTYANLFPKRVRALIVDAVLDPISWTTGRRFDKGLPVSTRVRSDAGAQDTLGEYFRLCDTAGVPRCAFAGNSSERFAALVEKLKAEPVTIVFPDGSELVVDNALLISATLNTLYNPFAWFLLANDLAFVEQLATTTTLSSNFSVFGTELGRMPNPDLVPQTIEGFPGVLCSDSDNPDNPFVWAFAGEISERKFGYFGKPWTWASSPCAKWPGSKKSRYAGPFTRKTANTVLVTSTVYDPATRYEGAVTVDKLLPDSHLLTVEGWGHTTLLLSDCATQIGADYLLHGTLPGRTSTCRQDFPPFFLDPGEVFGASAAASAQGLEAETQSLESSAEADAAAVSNRDAVAAERAEIMRAIMDSRSTYGKR